MEKKIGYEFMQATKQHTSLSAQQRGMPQPPLEWQPRQMPSASRCQTRRRWKCQRLTCVCH